MAIQINVTLTKAGLPIPAGSMIKPSVEFPDDILKRDSEGKIQRDENGKVLNRTRVVRMVFRHYLSKADFQNSPKTIDQVDQFAPGFAKALSDDEFAALSAPGNNALLIVEGFLKDWLENQLGVGTCSHVDPYSI